MRLKDTEMTTKKDWKINWKRAEREGLKNVHTCKWIKCKIESWKCKMTKFMHKEMYNKK